MSGTKTIIYEKGDRCPVSFCTVDTNSMFCEYCSDCRFTKKITIIIED